MHLFLLRHGDAPEYGFDDADRPLSTAGERQARIVGAYLKSSGNSPGFIFASPLVRAKRTAEIVGRETGLNDVICTGNLLPGTGERFLIQELNVHTSSSILLVGHEPQLRTFFAFLTGDKSSRIEFRKGALVCLESTSPLSQGSGVFQWVLTSEEMENL